MGLATFNNPLKIAAIGSRQFLSDDLPDDVQKFTGVDSGQVTQRVKQAVFNWHDRSVAWP